MAHTRAPTFGLLAGSSVAATALVVANASTVVAVALGFVVATVITIIVARGRAHRPTTAEKPAATESAATPSEALGDDYAEASGEVGRRTALRVLGMGALGVIPVVAAPKVLDAVALGSDGDAPASPEQMAGMAMAEPARTADGRIRQWTMIIDLRKCDGCQSQGTPPLCTQACIEGHFVPEPMEWIEVYEGPLEGGGSQFIPTPCQQCQNPPCVNVCPVGASFSTPNGPVLIDQERCIGCRICMAACPYDRRFFNWGEPPVPPEALLADYGVEHQIKAVKGTVMKCDFCPDMVRDGTLPYCVQACPNGAIYYGDDEEDIATNGREIVRASRFLAENHAYRLKEDLGTEPQVHYIPGSGELVGRDPFTFGRLPTEWPWVQRVEGAVTWSR